MSKKHNVVIAARVSTKEQDTERQVSELQEIAGNNGWNVVEVIRIKISGRSSEDDRSDLARIRELAAAGKINKVLVHEVSRLARRNSVLHKFVEDMTEAGVSIYWKSQNIETLLPNGKMNPAASIMLALLGEIARNETETARERIKSGMDQARKNGVKIGRPFGAEDTKVFLTRHRDIQRELLDHQSIRKTAKITGKSEWVVKKVKFFMSPIPKNCS